MKLGTVIVNYKTEDRVIKYVTEELPKITVPNKVVIVNNAATSQSNLKLVQGCQAHLISDQENIDDEAGVFVLSIDDNLGYSKGNNAGAEFLIKSFNPESILFSNSDLCFDGDDVIDRLIKKLNEMPKVALIGPSVESVSGSMQSPCYEKNIWQRHVIPRLFYPFLSKKLRRKLESVIVQNATEGSYDHLAGSIFLVRAKAFIKAGMFDPETFLFCEEPILACRIRSVGFDVYYYDKVKVIHEHAYTVRKLKLGTLVGRYDYQSNRYYQRKYRNMAGFRLFMFDLSYSAFLYIWQSVAIVWNIIKNKVLNTNRQ